MPLKRFILEMGSGNDLHGGDYTKAAVRAVQDALHHSSLAFIRSLGLNAKELTSNKQATEAVVYDLNDDPWDDEEGSVDWLLNYLKPTAQWCFIPSPI